MSLRLSRADLSRQILARSQSSRGSVVLSRHCPSNPGVSPQLSDDLRLQGCRGVSSEHELLGGSWLEGESIIKSKICILSSLS